MSAFRKLGIAAVATVIVTSGCVASQSSRKDDAPAAATSDPAPRALGVPKEQRDGSLVDPTQDQVNRDSADLDDSVGEDGRRRVIVQLDSDSSERLAASTERVARGGEADLAAVDAAQDDAAQLLEGTDSRIVTRLENFPVVIVDVDDEGLDRLDRSDAVASVRDDEQLRQTGTELRPLIGADAAQTAGWNGSGWSVAVIDSGFDTSHPTLRGKIAAEKCFRSCVNGANLQTGAGSSQSHCGSYFDHLVTAPSSSDCSHGTSVASVVTGATAPSQGVAGGAKLVLAKVGDETARANPRSASIAALDWVYSVRNTYKIAAVNMSFGSDAETNCDAQDPTFTSIIASLHSAGVLPVAASGNEEYTDSVSFPSCVTHVVSVGATETNDSVAYYSNSSSRIDLWAPGRTYVAELGGGAAVGAGTSYASPVVAGAAATIRQKNPGWTNAQVLSQMKATGVPVTDPLNSVTRSRIRVDKAVGLTPATASASNDNFASAATISATNPVVSTTLRGSSEVGEPAHAGEDAQRSVWWKYTPATSGVLTLDTLGTWFDTTLGVYTGSALGALTLVGSNDDLGPNDARSRVQVNVSAGVTYRIAVDTYSGRQQPVYLNWTGPGPSGSRYTALTPKRILDSRKGVGGFSTAWGPAATRSLTVAGGATGVPGDATAVVLNVTGLQPTSNAYLTLFPAGAGRPVASNINLKAGRTTSNAVTVKVGTAGAVQIFNSGGSTHVIAELVGYYRVGSGSYFNAITPKRLLDSRKGTGGYSSKWGAGTNRSLTVAGGSTTVPSNATAVVLNMTATRATATSSLTVSPAGVAIPLASALNFASGQTVANAVITKVGAAGKINIVNHSGSVDVLADVVGYFVASEGASFVPLTPTRVVDSRAGTGGYSSSWQSSRTRTFAVAGPGKSLPPNVVAAVLNLTVTGPSKASFVTVKPFDGDKARTSSINFAAGQTIANLVTVPLFDGQLDVYNDYGATHAILDLVGYYVNGS